MSNNSSSTPQADTFPGENSPVVGFRPELHNFLESAPSDDGSGILETQCGESWDAQDVESYDGTLGVTRQFVDDHQSQVGSIQWNNNLATIYSDPGNVNGARWCTGTLIADNLFLTAGHCFDDEDANGWRLPRSNGTTNIIPPTEVARNMHVDFNFQRDASFNALPESTFAVTELVEYRHNNLDYAIARLEGNPGAIFGVSDVSNVDATINDMLCIIGHPAGRPKQIEAGPASGFTITRIRYGDIDTLGGNSGSGILHGNSRRIVGVHTNGGCTTSGGFNVGVRITSIANASPIVGQISSATGQGEFYETDGSGGMSLLSQRNGWRRNWRLIVPGNFGGSSFTDLLFYDPVTGQGEFYATDGNGGMSLLTQHSGWRRNWRLIVPGNFGGGSFTDLLFYDPVTGQGEFYATDGNGGMSLLTQHNGWRRDWTQIVPGNFGGSSFTDLLFYDPVTGQGEFYATDGNGGMSPLSQHSGWRRGWTQIVPGNFGGSGFTDLLFYDPATGQGEFYATDGNGGMSSLSQHSGWRRDWKQIVPGNFDGSSFTDLLFYDSITGQGEFYATDGSGELSRLSQHSGWRQDWRLIVPGNFGESNFTDLLFYDPAT